VLEALTVQTFVVGAVMVVEATVAGRLAPPAEPGFWWAVAWVVGLSTFGGYGCYFLVLRRSGPTRVSALLYLTPPTTMVWAAIAFGDRPGPLALSGTAVCAAAVSMVLRRPRTGESDGPARPRHRPRETIGMT
jgi:drug/metabolite transporter (DMT)-like permease